MPTKHIAFLILSGFFIFTIEELHTQNDFQIGVGLSDDVSYLSSGSSVLTSDSIFFTNGPNGREHRLASDPSLSAFVRWSFFSFSSFNLSISAIYSKKYSSVLLHRLSEFESSISTSEPATNEFLIFQVRNTFFIPIQLGIKPFQGLDAVQSIESLSNFQFKVGVGPVFSWNALNPNERVVFSPGLFLGRMDPLFTETHHQFLHENRRNVTFDYSLSIETIIIDGFGIQALWSGSIGNVTKPFRVFNQELDVPLKTSSMYLFVTYSFTI